MNDAAQTELAVTLNQAQVDCAGRIYLTMAQWHLVDTALEKLLQRIPGFSPEAMASCASACSTGGWATIALGRSACSSGRQTNL